MERIEKRIAILYSLKREKITKVLKKYQLSYEDYQIVMTLHYAEGQKVEDVVKETGINPQFIHFVMDDLINKEYIQIENDQLYLTKKSKVLYPQIKRIVKECQDEIERQINTDEHHEMIEMLDRLIELYE